ncbi:MAG TPA: hypothetical protein VK656_02350, partial [Candidatus Acidoferrum sp.]|nr:hypothetical protein [Candidatus Acidoferrum sp.]
VAWGGLTDRRWTVPIAVTLALPVVWLNGLAILVALAPILALDHARSAARSPTNGAVLAESGPGPA